MCQLIGNELGSPLGKQCPEREWMSEISVELLETMFSPDLLNHDLREKSRPPFLCRSSS